MSDDIYSQWVTLREHEHDFDKIEIMEFGKGEPIATVSGPCRICGVYLHEIDADPYKIEEEP